MWCEFWTSNTANSVDSAFDNNMGFVVTNSNSEESIVEIYRGGIQIAQQVVAANSNENFLVDFDLNIINTTTAGLYVKSAFHIISTLSVSLYQFNPFDYDLGSDTFSY
jgi:hypothetical protein